MKTQELEKEADLGRPVRYLKGVGPEKQRLLGRLGLETLGDLFTFFPRRYEKRFPVKKVCQLTFKDKECLGGIIQSAAVSRWRGGLSVFRATVSDGKARFQVVYYRQPYLSEVLKAGAQVNFYGKTEKKDRLVQMVHPEYEVVDPVSQKETIHTGRWTPVYSLTEDLTQKTLRGILHRASQDLASSATDTLPEALRKRQALVGIEEAIRNIHFPADLERLRTAYERLVFEEFYRLEVAVERKRASLRKESRFRTPASGDAALKDWMETLDFELTGAQKNAIQEISKDMKSGVAMHRLLQGDVGSGKTVVAAAALYLAHCGGFQAAMMAPTEVLAQQLYFQIKQFLEPFGVRCVYLAQAMEPDQKKRTLDELADGTARIAVGTHALLSENVRFKDLGLAVVDEQHKFGVFQRAALLGKGRQNPHLLMMTATPIPRTLSMTLYGDLDISVIYENPKGRLPVRTYWVEEKKRPQVYLWMDALLAEGAQAYVICPQIGEDSPREAKNAIQEHAALQGLFPKRRLGLLHGRMNAAQKQKVMEDFKQKRTDVLVSTVVVEVGVDVPSARCMIIENADRFGLAQLHQLRGRVGRGNEESYCVLFSGSEDEESSRRLAVFEKTTSGFDIAEEDLAMRGPGEILGGKQHGLPELRIGDLLRDQKIFLRARQEAQAFVAAETR